MLSHESRESDGLALNTEKMEVPLIGKARVARRRRLEMRRLRSVGAIKDLETDGLDGKKKRAEKLKPTDFTGNSSDSASSCSDAEGILGNMPIRISASGGELLGPDLQKMPCRSHGSVSICGRRREMEDAVTVAPGFAAVAGGSVLLDFFAVYDGHGGSPVAHACRDRLHRIVAREIERRSIAAEELDWKEVMESCFEEMDGEVGPDTVAGDDVVSAALNTVGSTAVVAIVGTDGVVVANCGDSRAVISRGGLAVPLSVDHKPDRPDEMERVEAAGGRVINWDGYRVLGVLATSRSIGDHYLKPYVICQPEVMVSNRTDRDEFLILASDGLWDVISNDMACEITRRCLASQPKKCRDSIGGSRAAEAAALLAEMAMSQGSRDNISVVVVELKKSNADCP